MQLHVLGPAFGLPSIDPENLAAVATLRSSAEKQWEIIPAHDLSQQLPLLVDGDRKIVGLGNIRNHVTQQFNDLTKQQRADATAITSFVASHGQPLLDISLYVSYENYSTTRSAFTRFLPWYANYVVPPRRRAEAKKRTEHLGIASVDVDNVHEDLSNRPGSFNVGKEHVFEAETQQRASLLLPRKNTVRSFLRRTEHSAVFKLLALAENFFGPLQDMLGDGDYFLGTEKVQFVDCYVYGYLALMLYPILTHDWLAGTMRRKYGKLVRFVERMHDKLKMQTDADAVMALSKCSSQAEVEAQGKNLDLQLTWALPSSPMLSEVISSIAFDIATRIPYIGITRVDSVPAKHQPIVLRRQRYFPALLAGCTASFGLMGYVAFTIGLLEWPRGEAVHIFGRKRFADYGPLGAALAGLDILSRQMNNDVTFRPEDTSDSPVRVEVKIEKDGLP